jgi:uncharacterized membrane protein
MQRFWEIILGLERGFLTRQGEFYLSFNPSWPWQEYIGAAAWNLLLGLAALGLVIWVYRREGRSRNVRITLGIVRGLLLALVLALLNRPVLTLGQSRTEPSVLAILVDDSISMRVRDAVSGDGAEAQGRLEAAVALLAEQDQRLVRELAKVHTLRFYRFDSTALPLASSPTTQPAAASDDPANRPLPELQALFDLQPTGQNTQVGQSIRAVLDDLQGQRLAGVVVLTDGRDTPAQPAAATLARLQDSGVEVYPVIVGSDNMPTNVAIQSVFAQDSAFKDDIVNVRVQLRGTGFGAGKTVLLQLKDKKTGAQMSGPEGKPVEQNVTLDPDATVEAELQIKPTEIGQLDLVVEAVKQSGEIDDEDNTREIQIAVLDAKINVLYVDGYPRWEYRYIRNEMIRDATVDISCLLTSADPSFKQEGDRPITRFPESIEEMMDYDVVFFGDVDPRQFSDAQLQLVSDFVAKRGGGFGMAAGPRWSPLAYRGTPIELILPVNIAKVMPDDGGTITQGFRIALTKDGLTSPIFRFFTDKAQNEKYLRDDLQLIFWYCKGAVVKRGVGEVYAEHPTETGSDGRKSPILVLGRFGAGRTLFSAIDDSWRWRYNTGESIFDIYWVQQLRYLALSKKLGQRRFTLSSVKPVYELGQQVRVTLRVLDPQLLQQLPDQIRVDIQDGTGRVIRQESLVRQEGSADTYTVSFAADQIGKFLMKLPAIAGGAEVLELPIEVSVPRLELVQPQVDRVSLARIASETRGQVLELGQASQALPGLIPSAAKIIPIESGQPLWDAPLAMVLFVFLITVEWLLRKLYGML